MVVSGDVRVVEEWEEWLQRRVSRLGRADVAEKQRLVAFDHGKELELMGFEEHVWRRVGCPTPLRKIMAPRHGIRLAHGLAWAIDDGEVVVGEELGPSRLSSVEHLGR